MKLISKALRMERVKGITPFCTRLSTRARMEKNNNNNNNKAVIVGLASS